MYVYLIWFTFISDADFISLFPAPDRCVSPRAWEASVRWHGAVPFAFYYNILRLTSSYPFIIHCDFQDIINVFDYISVIIFFIYYELINFRSRYLSSCDWRGLIAGLFALFHAIYKLSCVCMRAFNLNNFFPLALNQYYFHDY